MRSRDSNSYLQLCHTRYTPANSSPPSRSSDCPQTGDVLYHSLSVIYIDRKLFFILAFFSGSKWLPVIFLSENGINTACFLFMKVSELISFELTARNKSYNIKTTSLLSLENPQYIKWLPFGNFQSSMRSLSKLSAHPVYILVKILHIKWLK